MIRLDERYAIDADEACYTLKEKKTATKKDGTKEVYYKPIGYYSSLFAALKGWYKESVRDAVRSRDMIITEALEVVEGCSRRVTDALKEAVKEPEGRT